MSKLHELAQLGQSIWYDYIRRSFLTSGEFQELIDKGIRGITSNPSIFEKAIAGSSDYDDDLRQLMKEDKPVDKIYEVLALKDISLAADILRPVYEETNGLDGYVSLEVSPLLAYDTQKTISEAKRLFEALDRPNIMIKVPATPAGIPAITALIGAGVNVNVTLIFGLKNYKAVAEAYLKGLERLSLEGPSVAGGHKVDSIASVASFFVSRVDSAVDQALERKNHKELQGTIAIANAKAAYVEFQNIFSGARWEDLAKKGARAQRTLWASTGTKNPLYADTLYMEQLIGPETVNTVPPATLNSFFDHGTISPTLTRGLEEATFQLDQIKALGIDLSEITKKLQNDGVTSFAKSFDSLMKSIFEKRSRLLIGKKGYSAVLGDFNSAVENSLMHIRDNKIMNRIWAHDYTVWKEDPAEIVNRLGWLHSPDVMRTAISEIYALVEEVRASGFTNALLLGMGGSSLAPEMFRFTFGVKKGYLNLIVLDSTDPGAVLEYADGLDFTKSLFIVSTKSGGTIETMSFMKYFYNHVSDAVGPEKTGGHFIAITDPGSGLESTAKELKFRKIFLNDPNIGGRYSALSFFGLVPAALIGMDIDSLLERTTVMACNSEGCNCPVAGDNAGAWLGAVIGELAKAGRDKLTLITSPAISHFGAWVEQLIAESTGKEGKGILPVDGESLAEAATYAKDRLFVHLRMENDSTHDAQLKELSDAGHPVVQINLRDLYDLGGECFRWEMATVVAGHLLGINPFDQPNVESAKVIARQMVSAYQREGRLPELAPTLETDGILVYASFSARNLEEAFNTFLAQANLGDHRSSGRAYLTLQAYVKPSDDTYAALKELRTKFQLKNQIATTLGYGPRFLHSTGQLHKGDGGHGLFIQITADMQKDCPIPDYVGGEESSISFGTLKMAQALGDRQALIDEGRSVIRFHIGKDVVGGLKKLIKVLA
ncbi:MAG: bifunctional transaldolase/phosoglucose isomerase [Thermodesulfobacteriota bacterium]|nr:bifunctional transaldolase/phosoglucose isomerase [Thermodesulfobacteriota bacterium]